MKKQTAFSVLYNPRKNKGTAFSQKERRKYGLEGILPDQVETMETQILRVAGQLEALEQPIQKYVYLNALLDSNETLFYRTVISDPARFLPLVYTPTVGEACERMGHIARRPRGLFISIKNKTTGSGRSCKTGRSRTSGSSSSPTASGSSGSVTWASAASASRSGS